jgi:SAM-dependent methyltransferase
MHNLPQLYRKVRSYISPFYLVRRALYRDIGNILTKHSFTGRVLDVGCGNKPFLSKFGDCDYVGIDFKNFSVNKDFESSGPNLYFTDKYKKDHKLPFKNMEFDSCLSFQVLEHHPEPDMYISEMSRVTKRGGYLLLTVPFLGGIHEEPFDFQRYTKYGLKRLFEKHGYKIIVIKEQGSLFSTISQLLNEYLNNFASKNRVKYLVSLLIYPPFLLFSYLSLMLDMIWKSNKIFFNYLVLAKRR